MWHFITSLHLLGRNLRFRDQISNIKVCFSFLYDSGQIIHYIGCSVSYFLKLKWLFNTCWLYCYKNQMRSAWKHSVIIRYWTCYWWLLGDSWAHVLCRKAHGFLSMELCCEKRIVLEIYMGFVSAFLCSCAPWVENLKISRECLLRTCLKTNLLAFMQPMFRIHETKYTTELWPLVDLVALAC